MFPEEINQILEKHQSNNINELFAIKENIRDIIFQLKTIRTNLATELKNLTDSDSITGDEDSLLNDLKILRKYITSFDNIANDNNSITEVGDSINTHDNIHLYLCYDELCPSCNWKMVETTILYRISKPTNKEFKSLLTYKCSVCGRYFVTDFELKRTNLKDSNIILHEDFYEKSEINFSDVIVLSTVTTCKSKRHNITDITAQIPIINNEGNIIYQNLNIAYCRECNKYIMLKEDFKSINGVIACQIIDQTSLLTKDRDGDEIKFDLGESVLYKYGYNVKAQENLSSKQRHLILSMVVEANIMSRGEVCSHLDTLIERGNKIPSWKNATDKWKQDRYYINSYNVNNLPKVIFDRIILKYSEITQ